jgi:hypothetical protein
MIASKTRYTGTAELLIAKGADVEAKDKVWHGWLWTVI